MCRGANALNVKYVVQNRVHVRIMSDANSKRSAHAFARSVCVCLLCALAPCVCVCVPRVAHRDIHSRGARRDIKGE